MVIKLILLAAGMLLFAPSVRASEASDLKKIVDAWKVKLHMSEWDITVQPGPLSL